jgi:amidase
VEETFRNVRAREVWKSYGDFVRSAKPEFGPGIKERIAFAATEAAARAGVRTLVPPGKAKALPTVPLLIIAKIDNSDPTGPCGR